MDDMNSFKRNVWYHSVFIIGIFFITYLCARMENTDFPSHLKILPKKFDLFHPVNYFISHPEPLWHYCVKVLWWFFRIPVEYGGAIVTANEYLAFLSPHDTVDVSIKEKKCFPYVHSYFFVILSWE